MNEVIRTILNSGQLFRTPTEAEDIIINRWKDDNRQHEILLEGYIETILREFRISGVMIDLVTYIRQEVEGEAEILEDQRAEEQYNRNLNLSQWEEQ